MGGDDVLGSHQALMGMWLSTMSGVSMGVGEVKAIMMSIPLTVEALSSTFCGRASAMAIGGGGQHEADGRIFPAEGMGIAGQGRDEAHRVGDGTFRAVACGGGIRRRQDEGKGRE